MKKFNVGLSLKDFGFIGNTEFYREQLIKELAAYIQGLNNINTSEEPKKFNLDTWQVTSDYLLTDENIKLYGQAIDRLNSTIKQIPESRISISLYLALKLFSI